MPPAHRPRNGGIRARLASSFRGEEAMIGEPYLPACGARTRSGTPCRSPAVYGNGRCKAHGGASTGPRTPEGRAAARANLKRGTRLGQLPEPHEDLNISEHRGGALRAARAIRTNRAHARGGEQLANSGELSAVVPPPPPPEPHEAVNIAQLPAAPTSAAGPEVPAAPGGKAPTSPAAGTAPAGEVRPAVDQPPAREPGALAKARAERTRRIRGA